jgi:ADP-ribosylglycohydrolase
VGAALLGREAKDDVNQVREAVEFIRGDLAFASQDDPELYGPELFIHKQIGYVRISLRLAFWHLFHAPTLQAALLDVVNRGGDSATNAAITGALLGAVYGESAIPEEWKLYVTEALYVRQGPLWWVYHPNALLTLVE